MNEEQRGVLTVGLWILSTVVLAALFISAAAQGELTQQHTELATIMLILATAGSVAIWRRKKEDAPAEKAKRRPVDNLLNNLSDDELAELKRRLMSVDAQKENVVVYLDDDGELKQRVG